jgi:hypothetical protein
MKKSQVSFEFIFAIGIVILIFTFFFVLMMNKSNDISNIKTNIDKDKECLRISNIISNVYKNGPGTEVNTKTNYVITVFNNSLLDVQDLANVSYVQNRIAVLLSEAGTSTQNFYDSANSSLHPDFYKVCFDDLGDTNGNNNQPWTGCQRESGHGTVNWSLIPNNLSSLIGNISNYQTIYLEDAHLHPSKIYNGQKYMDIITNWTAAGHVLIASEHFYCRDDGSGSHSNTSYQCDHSETSTNDKWGFFGNNLTQLNNKRNITIVSVTAPSTLSLGSVFEIQEGANISKINLPGTQVIAKYSDHGVIAKNDVAIAFWNYGSGQVFYIADFEVLASQQSVFSDKLSTIVHEAYYLIANPKNGGGRCNFYGNSPYSVITGNLTIKNINNIINITVNPS